MYKCKKAYPGRLNQHRHKEKFCSSFEEILKQFCSIRAFRVVWFGSPENNDSIKWIQINMVISLICINVTASWKETQ